MKEVVEKSETLIVCYSNFPDYNRMDVHRIWMNYFHSYLVNYDLNSLEME